MSESNKKDEERKLANVNVYVAPCDQPIIIKGNPFKKSRAEIDASKARTRENAKKLNSVKAWKSEEE